MVGWGVTQEEGEENMELGAYYNVVVSVEAKE